MLDVRASLDGDEAVGDHANAIGKEEGRHEADLLRKQPRRDLRHDFWHEPRDDNNASSTRASPTSRCNQPQAPFSRSRSHLHINPCVEMLKGLMRDGPAT